MPDPSETETVAIDPALLAILICPLTKSPLKQEGNELVSGLGGVRYPIRQGIAVLLIDQAKLPDGMTDIQQFKRAFNLP